MKTSRLPSRFAASGMSLPAVFASAWRNEPNCHFRLQDQVLKLLRRETQNRHSITACHKFPTAVDVQPSWLPVDRPRIVTKTDLYSPLNHWIFFFLKSAMEAKMSVPSVPAIKAALISQCDPDSSTQRSIPPSSTVRFQHVRVIEVPELWRALAYKCPFILVTASLQVHLVVNNRDICGFQYITKYYILHKKYWIISHYSIGL